MEQLKVELGKAVMEEEEKQDEDENERSLTRTVDERRRQPVVGGYSRPQL